MNRHHNMLVSQGGSNSVPAQQPTSNQTTNSVGSRSRGYRNRGEQQHHHNHRQRGGGRRGRNSYRGRSDGPTAITHLNDEQVIHLDQTDQCSDDPTVLDSAELDTTHKCPSMLDVSQTSQQPSRTPVDNSIIVPINQSNVDNARTNNRQSRLVGGKYKQRREARQLIDGLDGLDIELIESLAPSSSETSGRGRHMTNNRKINLSHLVNYNYNDRNNRSNYRVRNDSGSSVNNERHHQNRHYRYPTANEHKFSKQQFLQANCQFVVLDGYDHTIHKVDPDWPVDWEHIEEVKFRQIGATETNCPICLEQPIAAKITKCGHIYCWTCMLRYLSLGNGVSVPCPICFVPIYAQDLRSVVSQSYPNQAIGESITMKLMLRRKGCVEVEPVSAMSQRDDPDLSTLDTQGPRYRSQANLIIVDPATVVEQVTMREKNELQYKLELETSQSDEKNYTGIICFIEQAIDRLNQRINNLLQLSGDKTRLMNLEHKRLQASKKNEQYPSGRSYLFYQSADGQHIYLNPFSTKILCHEYGSLDDCPQSLQAEILQIDWISMNEAWRKRFKYLEHLPLTCEFRLIEIDFEMSNLVSAATFKFFEEQVKARSKERARRLREEAKRDKRIQVEQNRKIYGIQPSLEISLDNPEQFPSVSNELYLGLERSRPPSGAKEVPSDENDDDVPLDVDVKLNDTMDMTLSFAQIQLQEAAKAAKLAKQAQKKLTGQAQWSRSSLTGSTSTSGAQSSFAQLLTDAKTSQQKWTKSTLTSKASSWVQKQEHIPSNDSLRRDPQLQQTSNINPNDADDGGEELRAPPNQFSMSDYLEMNVVSGKKRGKKKKS